MIRKCFEAIFAGLLIGGFVLVILNLFFDIGISLYERRGKNKHIERCYNIVAQPERIGEIYDALKVKTALVREFKDKFSLFTNPWRK